MFYGFQKRRRSFFLPVAAFAALAVSGCGLDLDSDPLAFMTSPPGKKTYIREDNAAAPPDLLMNAPPLEMKEGGSTGVFGLNLETYFAGNMGDDPSARMDRMERALIAMHRDLKIMLPDLQHYADREQKRIDVAALLEAPGRPPSQPFDTMGQNGGAEVMATPDVPANAKPVALVPVSAPANPVMPDDLDEQPEEEPVKINAPVLPGDPVTPGPGSAQAAGERTVISGIRVGEHPDRVRIVFDITKKGTPYTSDLDNGEHILVVELPDAQWDTPVTSESFGAIPVLKSYKVERFNSGQGRIFVLQLKSSSKILAQSRLPALSGGGERIVIDLAK
ncbi:MAG: hypothetical protein KDJ75_05445 [Alphaproteobacteria bacterium]|nr:hypothetical protein [Alphaproteobacteria bacterium]